MDILSLQRKNGFFEIEVRLIPSDRFFPLKSHNIILHLKAKCREKGFKDGTIAYQIWDVKDFSGACNYFRYKLDPLRQSINSYIINHKDKEL